MLATKFETLTSNEIMQIVYHVLAVLGGAGVLIIALSKWLGYVWRDRIKERERKKSEMELEYERQRLGLRRVQADKFAESQFDVYVELWQKLQGLSMLVDALWDSCTRQNIAMLANELTETKEKVKKWSMFFEEEHLRELRRMFDTLGNFESGKIKLIKIRSQDDMDKYYPIAIERQINQNRGYREEFNTILERIRQSFRDRFRGLDAA